MYYAHSQNEDGEWQGLAEHLNAVAECAARFAAPFGASELACWAGLWHDLGKFHPDFQAYLGTPMASRGPDHKAAGALLSASWVDALAFLIQGHHGGLTSLTALKQWLRDKGRLVVPDNTRSGVSRACRYEPDLNRSYHELALHYGVAVLPARPRKPRDKAKVEVAVQIVQRWIVAALRHRRFFSLAELNAAIRERLEALNLRPFRKRPGCRASLFQELDWPALQPLPAHRYELHEWSTARVNIDYHIEFERHHYSVPYVLTGQKVEVRSNLTTLEIFHRGQRVASHRRSTQNYQTTTNPEHRPRSHQQHLAWPPSRLVSWAQSVGSSTAQLFTTILESRPHPQMGYRSCLGILRLGQRYSNERLEAAARRALATGACSYPSVKSILERSLDRQPLETPLCRPPLQHANLRGPAYFDFSQSSNQAGPASAKEPLC